jgi:branched-subunit amino acid ABC-type transport system permease component
VLYRLSGVLNFAAGDLVTLGLFAFVAGVALGPGAGALVAVLVVAAVAMAVQRLAVRPFAERGAALGWVAAIAAAGAAIRGSVRAAFPAESYSAPDLWQLSRIGSGGTVALGGGAFVDVRAVAALAAGMTLAIGIQAWLERSWTGRAIQAASQDRQAAALVGIPAQRLQMLAWAIVGGLAACAALLVAPGRPLSVELGVVLGLNGVAAAVVSGLESPRAAIAAGLAIGVVETAWSTFLPAPVARAHSLLPVALLVLAVVLAPSRLHAQESELA